jgi:hypothetical protein
MVHHTLKSTWGGHEPKRHYCKLVGAVSTGKDYFHPIRFSHGNLMVAVL